MSGKEGLFQVSQVECEAGDADSGASDNLPVFACHIFSSDTFQSVYFYVF